MNEILFYILITILIAGPIFFFAYEDHTKDIEKLDNERLNNFLRRKYEALKKQNKKVQNCKITDINNCSEKELRALPGINIIYAKRIIKRREEIGGFKDKDEFFEYLKLTETIKNELTPFLTFGKTEQIKSEKFDERNLDL